MISFMKSGIGGGGGMKGGGSSVKQFDSQSIVNDTMIVANLGDIYYMAKEQVYYIGMAWYL